jgi:hypothetical protein
MADEQKRAAKTQQKAKARPLRHALALLAVREISPLSQPIGCRALIFCSYHCLAKYHDCDCGKSPSAAEFVRL